MKDHATDEHAAPRTSLEAFAAAGVILLGEPDPELYRPILGLLQGDGHEVLHASEFKDLIDLVFLRGGELSACVLDVDLLVQDEVDLVERIHAMRPGLPVLVLAPFGRNMPRLETDYLHTIRILRKPLEPVLVRSRLREELGMESGGQSGAGGADRRAFPRMNLDARTAVSLPDGRVLPVIDISSGGIALLSDFGYPPGHTLDFSYRMVSGFATVVRSSTIREPGPFPGVNHLVRCRFGANMHPADVEVLMDLLG